MQIEKKPKSLSKIEIPADLSPADARTLIDQIRTELGSKRKSMTFDLDTASVQPSISAMQILVSLQATTSRVAITLGRRAQEAIDELSKPQYLEMKA